MEKSTVSKMGLQLLVGLTDKGFEHGEMVILKPKGMNVKLYLKVSKQGKRLVAIIPKDYHQFFEKGNIVSIEKYPK